MVNVILNNPAQRSTISYDVSNNAVDYGTHVPDNIAKMGEEVGLNDLANQLNQESQEFDQQLREDTYGNQQGIPTEEMPLEDLPEEELPEPEQDYPQEEHESKAPKKQAKARHSKKRYTDLAVKYGYEAEKRQQEAERRIAAEQKAEALEQQLELERQKRSIYEKELLKSQGNLCQSNIDKAYEILFQARQDQDSDTEKEALKVINRLQNEQFKTEDSLQHIEYQDIQHQKQKQVTDPREAILSELYTPRELENVAVDKWLKENPECNPYSSEFDAEYAQEVNKVKQGLNKWLMGQRQKHLIGEDEYYDLLNDSLDIHFGRNQQPVAPQPAPQEQRFNNGGQVQRQNNQYYNDDAYYSSQQQVSQPQRQTRLPDMYRVPLDRTPRPPVSNVSRSGYGQQTPYAAQGMPELTSLERELALKWPVYDERGQQITDPRAKIEQYKREKARASSQRG